MKYLSLFSGIGGFEKAIQDVLPNAECVGFSEIDKYAQQIYLKHFPNHKPYGDITKLTTDSIPDFDLLVGGFPCQSFSIAGKRRGFEDTRGTLFFEIARILRDKRPTNFILENVAGLLSHDEGNTFKVIISTLDELGYFVEWQVLNSKNFGVPQNRERVFIIGHLGGEPSRKVFPITEGSKTVVEKYGNKNPSGNGQSGQVVSPNGLHPTIGAGGGNPNRKRDIGWSSGYIAQLNNPTHSNNRIYGDNGISPALNTMQGGNRQPKIVASRGRNPGNSSDRTVGAPTEQRLEENSEGISNTLTSVQKDNLVLAETRIRRLTPLECERLQGFPDNWTEGVSDTQRYKCCGNAVTVNVVRAIVERLEFNI